VRDFFVGRSKTGLPTIAERGGGMTNTGNCMIVCGPSGERIKPLFVPRGYSNDVHAIFVARIGDHIIEAGHNRGGENATVWRIDGVGTADEPDKLVVTVVGEYEDGDGNIPAEFATAVEAAFQKSHCYHCREAHYAAEQVRKNH